MGLDVTKDSIGGGGQLVERFACLVAAGELVVGQSHVGYFARWDGGLAGSDLAPVGWGWSRPCLFRPMVVGGSGKRVGSSVRLIRLVRCPVRRSRGVRTGTRGPPSGQQAVRPVGSSAGRWAP